MQKDPRNLILSILTVTKGPDRWTEKHLKESARLRYELLCETASSLGCRRHCLVIGQMSNVPDKERKKSKTVVWELPGWLRFMSLVKH